MEGYILGASGLGVLLAARGLGRRPAEPSPPSDHEAMLVEAVDWAAAHGMLVRPQGTQFDHCPFSLLPTPFPRAPFEEAVALGPTFARLTDAVARDTEWLHGTLAAAGQGDEFTERLLEVSRAVHKEGIGQPLQLGILRSDYMLHEPTEAEQKLPLFTSQAGGAAPKRFMQVELNCIASSFGCMGCLTSELHKYLLTRYPAESAAASPALAVAGREMGSGCAPNHNLAKIPASIHEAHVAYLQRRGGAAPPAPPVVVFVVQDGESNSVDQRLLEYGLWNAHGLRVLRRSLGELHRTAELQSHTASDGTTARRLVLDGAVEVSVVYYRAGYTPDDYPSEAQWDARLLVERSAAVKCPSIDYHLTGAKKVQQALAAPGAVERFLSAHEARHLRTCFAGLFPAEQAEAVEAATQQPELFVLKPQREGGGNNFYGDVNSHTRTASCLPLWSQS